MRLKVSSPEQATVALGREPHGLAKTMHASCRCRGASSFSPPSTPTGAAHDRRFVVDESGDPSDGVVLTIQ